MLVMRWRMFWCSIARHRWKRRKRRKLWKRNKNNDFVFLSVFFFFSNMQWFFICYCFYIWLLRLRCYNAVIERAREERRTKNGLDFAHHFEHWYIVADYRRSRCRISCMLSLLNFRCNILICVIRWKTTHTKQKQTCWLPRGMSPSNAVSGSIKPSRCGSTPRRSARTLGVYLLRYGLGQNTFAKNCGFFTSRLRSVRVQMTNDAQTKRSSTTKRLRHRSARRSRSRDEDWRSMVMAPMKHRP